MCRCVCDGYSLLVYICSYVCGAFVWSMCTSIYMYAHYCIYSEADGNSEAGGACVGL